MIAWLQCVTALCKVEVGGVSVCVTKKPLSAH